MGSGWHPLSSASSWPTPPQEASPHPITPSFGSGRLGGWPTMACAHPPFGHEPIRPAHLHQQEERASCRRRRQGICAHARPPGTHTPLSFPRRVRVVWELRHSCSPPAGRHRVPRGWAGACASELSTDADASAYCTVHMRRECACAARRANRWQRPATYIHTRACPFVALFVLPPSPRPPPQQQQQQ